MTLRLRFLLPLAVLSAALPSASALEVAALPEPVTSFGAVVSDGQLYVYGGHRAGSHEWSLDTTSGTLRRLDLKKAGATWEQVGQGPKVQSPGLAAHGGKIYLIGGMQPQNKEGEKPVLKSTSHAMVFDPASKQWSNLPDLPAPRSSHEIAILDGRLYVVGGWPLDTSKTSDKPDDRHATRPFYDAMWVLDLASPVKWETLPQPPQRRAIALVASKGKLYMLGGMNPKNEVTADADVYDVAAKTWSKLPEIPADGKFKAFATAACELDGRVIASPSGGKVFALDASGKAWKEVGALKQSRFFHQLEPWSDSQVIALGGTKGGEPLADVEVVAIEPAGAVAGKSE